MYRRGWDAIRLAGERVVVGQSVDSEGISGDMTAETSARFSIFSWKITDIIYFVGISARTMRGSFLPDTGCCSEIAESVYFP